MVEKIRLIITNMNKHQSIKKIALLGMNKRSVTILKKFMEQTVSSFYEIVDISSAELAILDLDGTNQRNDLDFLQNNYSQLPVVAISIIPQDIKGLYFLRKPLSLQKFTELTQFICTQTCTQISVGDGISTSRSQCNTISEGKDKQKIALVADGLTVRTQSKLLVSGSYANTDDMFFDPEEFTLAYVLKGIEKAKKTKKQVVIKMWDEKTILIDAAHGKILTDISTAKMRTLGVVVVDNKNSKVRIKTADLKLEFDFNPRFNCSIRVSTIDEFVWRLAYITCRGRLPKYLSEDVPFDLQQPVYINEWPNFTRMENIPHAISTVAFWIQQPIKIGRLSSLLNVSNKDINSLFFACFSIGIAGQAIRKSDSMVEMTHAKKHQHRGLFGSILNHLKGKS